MDPAKLKVVELRAELQKRGLDTKGNKPVLVKRLKEALEAELETELPDTSIADTSTEDCGQDDDCMVESSNPVNTAPEMILENADLQTEICSQPESEAPTAVVSAPCEESQQEPQSESEPVGEESSSEEKQAESAPAQEVEVEPTMETEAVSEPAKDERESVPEPDEAQPQSETTEAAVEEEVKLAEIQEKVEQNGDNTNGDAEEDSCEPRAKKSRWGADTEPATVPENELAPATIEDAANKEQKEERGDKRKHSSPSPERNQRQRSKSPICEDEPAVDANKVQLSWYDSDLHLQIDKASFLSAKPLNDGLFAYIWAGARVTHGVRKSDKACYEVKIAEELKFDDILSSSERRDNRRDRRDGKREDRERSRAKSENGSEKTSVVEQTDGKTDQEKTEDLPNTEDVSKTEDVPRAEDVLAAEDVPRAEDVPKAEDFSKIEDVPMTEDVPKTEDAAEDAEAEVEAAPLIETMETEQTEVESVEKTEPASMVTDVATDEVPQAEDKALSDAGKAEEGKPEEVMTETEPTEKEEMTEESEKPTKAELVKIPSHLIRIGWSHPKSSLQLGEDKLSFGLESSGMFYANKTVVATEATFKVGDVVRAFVDMSTRELTFAINGTVAYVYKVELSEEEAEDLTLFPHILTRNLRYDVNTGDSEEALSGTPDGFDDYTFVSKLEDTVAGVRTPEKREDCEVIMMYGLPGAGKTHWVNEYIQTAEKKYNVVGASFLMDRMTVDGNSIRACICPERMPFFWNQLHKCITRLADVAPLRRRDFILDQTNLFPPAIRRKMRSFLGFKRHAVIVVNEDEEQEKQRMKQLDSEAGKDMSVSALLQMKASMGLPKLGDNLEQVTYISLPEDKAQEQVQKYNKQGRDRGFGNTGHHRRDYRDDRNNRWHRGSSGGGGGGPRRDYQHRNNYRDRPYQNNRYDRNYRQGSGGGGGGGGGGSWRPGGGGGGGGGGSWMQRNDRRDNRGPRDWRNNNRSGGIGDRPQNRGSGHRDHRSHSNSSGGGNYNRNRNQSGNGSGGGGGRWGGHSGGAWGGQSGGGGSGGGAGGGNWNSGQGQDWNSGWNQSQGSWNQNQWKYGGGYNQGGYSQYPQNWNSYYGGNNYSQDAWNGPNVGGHGQGGSSSVQTSSSTTNTANSNNSYAPSSMMASQQQPPHQQHSAWSQYAQPYTPGATSNANSQK